MLNFLNWLVLGNSIDSNNPKHSKILKIEGFCLLAYHILLFFLLIKLSINSNFSSSKYIGLKIFIISTIIVFFYIIYRSCLILLRHKNKNLLLKLILVVLVFLLTSMVIYFSAGIVGLFFVNKEVVKQYPHSLLFIGVYLFLVLLGVFPIIGEILIKYNLGNNISHQNISPKVRLINKAESTNKKINKNFLMEKLSENAVEPVIDTLKPLINSSKNHKLKSQLIILLSRWNRFQENKQIGILSSDEINKEANQINEQLLNLINRHL